MRIPVFHKHSNPFTDAPIQRKKLAYVSESVDKGFMDWIDPRNQARGAICRSIFPRDQFTENLTRIAGSGFDSAWSIIPSGGVPVWQMRRA